MGQTKYDVFISYSRKDYVKDDVEIPDNPITAIMECFDQNGVSYWIDKKGIYSGQKFIEVITEAINNSKMLVFVSSKHSNEESRWTVNEIFEAYDEEKLIIPFRIDESKYNKAFKMIVRPNDYIEYYKHPNTALEELIRAIYKEKERLREEEQKKQEKQRIEEAKQQLIVDIKEFQRLNGEQDFLLRSLYSKSKDVGAKTKKCPVCEAEMLIEVPYCESCGWSFASLYGVYGVDGKSLHDEKHLRIVRGLWKDLREGKGSKATAHSLEQEKRAQQEQLRVMEQELRETTYKLNNLQKDLDKTQKLYDGAKEEKLELEKQVKNFKQQIKELESKIKEKENKVTARKIKTVEEIRSRPLDVEKWHERYIRKHK